MSKSIIGHAEPAHVEGRSATRPDHVLDAQNAVAISAAHLKAAMKMLAAMPSSRRDPLVDAQALRQFARDAGFADEESIGTASHARIIAFSNWIELHDPHWQSDTGAIYEAAARFPLTKLPSGFGFDPAGFQEMVLFIEELPW